MPEHGKINPSATQKKTSKRILDGWDVGTAIAFTKLLGFEHTKELQMSHRAVFLVLVSLILTTLGCSSERVKSETALNQKVEAEPSANSPEEIANRAAESFANAPGLTTEQRRKLMGIYLGTYANAMAIREEIGKSKGLMFKLISTANYKSKEVDLLKQKIVGLDQKRLDIMFKALAEVQGVVGYGESKEPIYRHLRDYEVRGHRTLSSAD